MTIARRVFLATGVAIVGGYAAARAWRTPQSGTAAPAASLGAERSALPDGALSASPPSGVAAQAPKDAAGFRTVMTMRPAWLPDGVVEDHRSSTVGAGRFVQRRSWTGDGHEVSLEVDATTEPAPESAGPIWIESEDGNHCIAARMVGPGLRARITAQMPRPRDGATRIVSSLVGDERTVCEVAMRFDWLPPTTPRDRFALEMRRPRGEPLSQALYTYDSPQAPARAWALTGPTEQAVLNDIFQMRVTDPVTVRGRPGRYAFAEPFGRVLVELAPGKWLCVNVDGFQPPLGRHDLLRVAESMWIGDVPAWQT